MGGVGRARVAIVVAAGLLAVLPAPAPWVEALYSRRLYVAAQNVLTPLSNLVPFALFDLLAAAAAAGAGFCCCNALRRAGPGRRLRALPAAGLRLAAPAAGLYLVFLLVWGLNYRREPLAAQLGHEPGRVTSAALSGLGFEAADRLNALHPVVRRAAWPAPDALPARLGAAFDEVQRRLGNGRTARAGVPKATLLAPYFRLAGIDGMVSPFSLEVLINPSVLPFERPWVVAHEWGHLAGYADESEASFVGWLICLAGGDASRYSAWLHLLPRVARRLDEAARGAVWARLDAGPARDLRAAAARAGDAAPFVRRNANRVYDRYLRANRVEAGIASYGDAVDLILAGAASWRPLADRQPSVARPRVAPPVV